MQSIQECAIAAVQVEEAYVKKMISGMQGEIGSDDLRDVAMCAEAERAKFREEVMTRYIDTLAPP